MDIGSILIMLAITILVIAFIARPFAARGGSMVSQGEQRLSALQAERDKVLSLIQELELDHAAGKIPDEDYLPQRTSLVQHGAEVLREIDGLQPVRPEAAARTAPDLESQIEVAVARLRQTTKAETSPGYCAKCGKPLVPGDRFCSHCGAPVPVGEATA
jgi:hypothetical protein